MVGQVVNVTTSLNIRKGASSSTSIVGTMPNGALFIINGQSGEWYYIEYQGGVGYVYKSYVKVINDSQSTKQGQVINVTTSLNIRKGPATSTSIVGTMKNGDTFLIYGQSGDWYFINFKGVIGYIYKDYVKVLNTSTIITTFDKIFAILKSQLGSPYVYGGDGEIITTELLNQLKNTFRGREYIVDPKYINTGYRAFDCSGFMHWGFLQLGIDIGRTTYDQVTKGVAVTRANIKPGDLVFYSSVGHVGMYIGNDQWIEASHTGDFVKITSIPWNLIGQIRRVI